MANSLFNQFKPTGDLNALMKEAQNFKNNFKGKNRPFPGDSACRWLRPPAGQ